MSDEPKLEGGHTTMQIPQGSMFLYDKPQILTREDHGSLGISPAERPFDFAAKAGTVPLVASEIASAQKNYPVIFSNPEEPRIFAVVSIIKDRNMFVEDDGRWTPFHYIPAYLRRHPFAFARGEGDQYALVIDRAAASISEEPRFPFFDGDELSADTRKMVDFCSQVESEGQRTREFTDKLKELDLLTVQEVTQGPPPTQAGNSGNGEKAETGETERKPPLASYYAVDPRKLTDLAPEVLQELHQKGYLGFIFAHLFSMENWGKLMERRNKMMAAASESQ